MNSVCFRLQTFYRQSLCHSLVRSGILCSKLPFLICLVIISSAVVAQQKLVFEQPKMGSPFTITVYALDSVTAANAAAAAFRRADTLNSLLSDYIDSSEINRLSATSGQGRYVPVSSYLYNILKSALEAAQLSNGAYDISIGPVVKLWRKARKQKQFPNTDSLRIALSKIGYQYIHLDSVQQSVWLEKKGMQLDIGGLGKGYVAQLALEVLQQSGLKMSMVNAGGKIVTGDAPPGKKGWLIGINMPGEKQDILPQLLLLHNNAIATSGDIYQFVELDGKRYSHIVNPATGIGLTRSKNVTAIAQNGITADWLSTACSVLSCHKSMRLIKRFKGGALLIAEKRKNRVIQKRSAQFNRYLQPIND